MADPLVLCILPRVCVLVMSLRWRVKVCARAGSACFVNAANTFLAIAGYISLISRPCHLHQYMISAQTKASPSDVIHFL